MYVIENNSKILIKVDSEKKAKEYIKNIKGSLKGYIVTHYISGGELYYWTARNLLKDCAA